MKYKFKIGERVRIINSGSGCGSTTIGKVFTIIELGHYGRDPGYRINDKETMHTNSCTNTFNGMIGEISFELAESAPLIFNQFN